MKLHTFSTILYYLLIIINIVARSLWKKKDNNAVGPVERWSI